MRFSFFLPFLSTDLSFFFGGTLFSPHPSFGFFHQNFPPLPHPPTFTYYSPTHLFTYLLALSPSYLPSLGRYLPNPTFKASSTYLVTIPIDPAIAKNNEGKKNEGIALSLDLFIEANLRA